MNSTFKSLQSLGVLLLVLGLFLGAIWYFHDSIPEIRYGSMILQVMEPPLWSLAGSFGAGALLLIVGAVGAAADKGKPENSSRE